MTDRDYSDLTPKHPLWKRFASPLARLPNSVDLGCWIRQDRDRNPLRALVSVDLGDHGVDDGAGHWLHISVSRKSRLPTWGDLVLVRDELGYRDLCFVQLVPPARAWMNAHSYCLHLWCRLDADTVPAVLWDNGSGDGSHYRREGALTGRRVT